MKGSNKNTSHLQNEFGHLSGFVSSLSMLIYILSMLFNLDERIWCVGLMTLEKAFNCLSED
jgi:hypothetical protein